MAVQQADIDEIQAGLLRTLASAHRLRIVHRLGVGVCGVGELARDLGLNQPATSQHLAVMRAAGIVEAVRDGRSVSYRLSDPEILAACGIMRRVLVRRLVRMGDLAAAVGDRGPSSVEHIKGGAG
jgi:DNA-binding transcriptional ArsR family regulator